MFWAHENHHWFSSIYFNTNLTISSLASERLWSHNFLVYFLKTQLVFFLLFKVNPDQDTKKQSLCVRINRFDLNSSFYPDPTYFPYMELAYHKPGNLLKMNKEADVQTFILLSHITCGEYIQDYALTISHIPIAQNMCRTGLTQSPPPNSSRLFQPMLRNVLAEYVDQSRQHAFTLLSSLLEVILDSLGRFRFNVGTQSK